MRTRAAALNRFWLSVIGLVLIAVGALGALAGLGSVARWTGRLPAQAPVLPERAQRWIDITPGVLAMLAVGVLLVLAGLGWLVRMLPRRDVTAGYRLHDRVESGLTRVETRAIAEVLSQRLEAHPAVTSGQVLLRGSAAAPALTLKVRMSDDADPAEVRRWVSETVLAEFATALEVEPASAAVLFEVDRAPLRRASETVLTSS